MKWLQRAIWLGKQRNPEVNQTAIAELAGVARSQVTKWKKGEGNPSLDQVLRIARGLGVSLDYLLHEEQDWLAEAEKVGVGPVMDKDAEALLRLLAALDVSPAEAMRRVVAPDEKSRIVAVQAGKHRLPASNESGGEPVAAGGGDRPAGKRGRVDRRRTDEDLK